MGILLTYHLPQIERIEVMRSDRKEVVLEIHAYSSKQIQVRSLRLTLL